MIKTLHYLTNFKSTQIFIYLYFIVFLVLGLLIFKDYGISIDEDNTRIVGFLSLEQLFKFFSFGNTFEITEIIKQDALAHTRDNTSTSGTIFDLPMAYLEYIFKIIDSKNYFLLRHFFTFIVFFFSTIYFYKIALDLYNSKITALLGTSFLILSPRIFGESFFNNKDIVFMSFFIIGIYYAIKFLYNKNILSVIVFAFVSAVVVNMRILGAILPLLIIFINFLIVLRTDRDKSKIISRIILFLLMFPIFYLIIWPELWTDPFGVLFKTLNFMRSHFLSLNIFYLGEYYFFSEIPWHYHLVSILTSTPLLYIFLFLIGFVFIFKRLIIRLINIEENNSHKDLWRGKKELIDYIFLIIVISVILIAIDTGKISYNGWRHLYFIYPCIILISLRGLYILQTINILKNRKNVFKFCIFLTLIPTAYWMLINHPFQNLYFNSIFKSNYNKYFEVDYWGLTNKKALEIIIEQGKDTNNVYMEGTSDLNLSKRILNKNDRKKINIVGTIEEADFIVNHFYNWRNKGNWQKNEPPVGFKILEEIKIDDISINSIYKKSD